MYYSEKKLELVFFYIPFSTSSCILNAYNLLLPMAKAISSTYWYSFLQVKKNIHANFFHLFLSSNHYLLKTSKEEKIYEDSLDSIPSPSPSVKIQIMSRKVCLRCELFVFKSLLTTPNNILPYYLK